MKFDVVVGNPPYQENDNGKRDDGAVNASASPLYHLFFNMSKNISNDKVSLIFPARWLSGAGKGLGNFSKEMINDTHIKSITVFENSKNVFPNTDIKGGVLYLTYDLEYEGKAEVTVIDSENETNRFKSYLNSAGSGIFIPYGELISIYEKVSEKENLSKNNIKSITSTRKPYGLSTDFFKSPAKYDLPKIYDANKDKEDIEILGLENSKRVIKYVPKDYPITKGVDSMYKWKLFSGKAMGSGTFGEKVPDLPIGKPGQIATETFIQIGTFNSKFEAESLQKYYYTKFFRALLGILKNTQDAPARVYEYIPLQDFSINSDINWNMSLTEIDQQLYDKYNLTQEERDFIERKVESME